MNLPSFALAFPHDFKLNQISEAECKEWAGLLAKDLEAQYFNNTLGTLRGILKRAGIVGVDLDSASERYNCGRKAQDRAWPGDQTPSFR